MILARKTPPAKQQTPPQCLSFWELYYQLEQHVHREFDGEVRFSPCEIPKDCLVLTREYPFCLAFGTFVRLLRERGNFSRINVSATCNGEWIGMEFFGEGGDEKAFLQTALKMQGFLRELATDASFSCDVGKGDATLSLVWRIPVYTGTAFVLHAVSVAVMLAALQDALAMELPEK